MSTIFQRCFLLISGDVQDEDKLVRTESQAGANLYLYQVRSEQEQTAFEWIGLSSLSLSGSFSAGLS